MIRIPPVPYTPKWNFAGDDCVTFWYLPDAKRADLRREACNRQLELSKRALELMKSVEGEMTPEQAAEHKTLSDSIVDCAVESLAAVTHMTQGGETTYIPDTPEGRHEWFMGLPVQMTQELQSALNAGVVDHDYLGKS